MTKEFPMSFTDTLTSVPEQVLDAISTTQELFLSTVRSLAETTKSYTQELPELPFADQLPSAVSVVESAYASAEKFLANQKEFSVKLIEAYLPAKSATKVTAKATKAA
jgi:hypothetical protein